MPRLTAVFATLVLAACFSPTEEQRQEDAGAMTQPDAALPEAQPDAALPEAPDAGWAEQPDASQSFYDIHLVMSGNLHKGAPIPANGSFDPQDPGSFNGTIDYAARVDGVDGPFQVIIFFCKTAENSWDWHAMVWGQLLMGGTAGVYCEIAAGILRFDEAGLLVESDQVSSLYLADGTRRDFTVTYEFTQQAGPLMITGCEQR